jgi:hypothetical protein
VGAKRALRSLLPEALGAFDALSGRSFEMWYRLAQMIHSRHVLSKWPPAAILRSVLRGIPKCWQIFFHVGGLRLTDDEGGPIRGFYTVRRAIAHTASEAEEKATRRLVREEKMQFVLSRWNEDRSTEPPPKVEAEKVELITWRCWLAGRYAKGFIFYGDED